MNQFKEKIKPFILTTLCIVSFTQLNAQESNDLEGWSSVQLDVKATEKLYFSAAEHLRYKNDISILNTYFTQLETNYEIFKGFQLGAGVRFIKKNDDIGNKQGIESHFRYQIDARYKHKVKQLNLSYRFRYQNKNELGLSEEEGDIAKEQLRFMMDIGYKLKPIGIVFKLKGELFDNISKGSGSRVINRNRFTLMASKRFNKVGKFSLFYRVQETMKPQQNLSLFDFTIVSKRIIGLKYSYLLDFIN
ncbi:MAG: DUF2490 domain-containing protein [Flavobacteriaceae bacterium]|nr:DUF2490 domain-containing protein [Flavobacteriaceae bacterium]